MYLFSVLDENNIVTNNIVADSKEIAEQLTGQTCIEFFQPEIGDKYENNRFVKKTE